MQSIFLYQQEHFKIVGSTWNLAHRVGAIVVAVIEMYNINWHVYHVR